MSNSIARNWPYPRLVAHRGAGKLAPENTLAAMRVGYAHGYRMVEFDVKLASDSVAFLLHDATLERTSDGRGRADAYSWRELSRLDAGAWHSSPYAGEPLPTLTSIARWARAHSVCCDVEIKPSPGRDRETGASVTLDAAEFWKGADTPPLLTSFSEEALASAQETAPDLPRALLLETLPDDWLARLARLECVGVNACHKVLSADVVRAARAAGYRVACYTPNDPARVHELAKWGVDCIVTDAIDKIAANALPPPAPLP